MADELQGLLKRIQAEGLEQAEATKEATLRDAKAEAEDLVAKAKSKAEQLIAEARREADLLRQKGEQSLKQAARDVLLSLREQLESRVVEVARSLAVETSTPETVADIVATMAKTYLEAEQSGDLELRVPAEQQDALANALAARLGQDLADRCHLAPVPDVDAGFRLVVSDQDIVYDFTDESLAETMASFLSPRLADVILGVVDGDK
jgi:V/A-type H+-transporting ATPase subunit E